jgi:hypothetical protein
MERPSQKALRVTPLFILGAVACIAVASQHGAMLDLTRDFRPIHDVTARRVEATSGYRPVEPQSGEPPDEDRKSDNPLAGIKIAIQMTTHLSESHLAFLHRCWPVATQRLTLFKHSDLILFTSSNSSRLDEWLEPLEFANKTVRHYDVVKEDPYHGGAKLALVDPFEKGYLDGYDWVIRLNPDVLIRNETWLLAALQNPDIDGIFVWCSPPPEDVKIHTDFMAFRPRAVVHDPEKSPRQYAREIERTEPHAETIMSSIIKSGRHARLPGGECYRRLRRVVGKESPVVHAHNLVKFCPDYFDAHGVARPGGMY